MRHLLVRSIATFLALSAPSAFGSQYFSAHFCQPYRNGGEPQVQSYYQSQGSVLAVVESALVCPVQAVELIGVQHVRLYYSTLGVTAQPAISCRLWKISAKNETLVGPTVQGFAGQDGNYVDVFSQEGPLGTVGANVECILKPQAKILGYYLF
jgi:hypothetical protein